MFGIFDKPSPDPNPLPMTDSPWPVTFILACYIIFVLKLGKIYMRNRDPYDLRRVLYAYNLGQVAYNGIYFAITFYYLVLFPICDWRCMEPFPFGHERKNLERYMHYAYFINKIMDLLDTVFFVLRKSYKQISFLHVYHHVLMVSFCYIIMRFYGTGGHFNAIGMINAFVHTAMYFYYFLSSFYPGIKMSIWWKKYITITQLAQFVIFFFHATFVLFFSEGCGFPSILLHIVILQAVVMIYMFGNFYINAYIRPVQRRKQD